MRRSGEQVDAYPLRAGGKVRDRFERWLVAASVGAMLTALEHRAWRDTERMRTATRLRSGRVISPEVMRLWCLEAADVARVRAAAIAAIEAAGGRVDLGVVVATVAAGELRITMA